MNLFTGIKRKLTRPRPIHIAFLCTQMCSNLLSIYNACKADKQFRTFLIALPVFEHHDKETFGCIHWDGVDQMFEDHPDVIWGYSDKTGEWIDLKALNPDFVFYSRPYNMMIPEHLRNTVVSQYARTCFTPYAAHMIGQVAEPSIFQREFFENASYFFLDFPATLPVAQHIISGYQMLSHFQMLTLGSTKLDAISASPVAECHLWKLPRNKASLRVIWLPRWNTREDNCHFFDYNELLLDYARKYDHIELILRPHPLCFRTFTSEGDMTKQQLDDLRNTYSSMPNASIDEKVDYVPQFQTCDAIIADKTSLIAEFFVTGKPVILCLKNEEMPPLMRALASGCYIVRSWRELEDVLTQLQTGEDPLKPFRQKIITEQYVMPPNGAGNAIKEKLKADFLASH